MILNAEVTTTKVERSTKKKLTKYLGKFLIWNL